MTAETFIREKLIPWLETQINTANPRNESDAAIIAELAQRDAQLCLWKFIEQHKTEWHGSGE